MGCTRNFAIAVAIRSTKRFSLRSTVLAKSAIPMLVAKWHGMARVARNGTADSQAMMPAMIAGPRDRRGDRKAFAGSRAKDARDRASGAVCAFWAATFAARSGFRFKVALAISAGGNFGRPLITVDRGDTSGGGVLGDLQRPWLGAGSYLLARLLGTA